MCRHVPRHCAEDVQTAGLMLLLFLFKLAHPLKHIHTVYMYTHTQALFLTSSEAGSGCEQKKDMGTREKHYLPRTIGDFVGDVCKWLQFPCPGHLLVNLRTVET